MGGAAPGGNQLDDDGEDDLYTYRDCMLSYLTLIQLLRSVMSELLSAGPLQEC